VTGRVERMVAAVTLIAAVVMALCVVVLTVDYVAARRREPRDEVRITELQKKVRTNASVAPGLESDKKRIADARRARKARINFLAVVTIVAAVPFLSGAKRLLARRADQSTPRQDSPKVRASKSRREAFQRTVAPADTSIDLAFVDAIVAREGRSQEAAIPILQAIQTHYRYLPDEALKRVCEITEIAPAQISGTSSFYSRFRRSPAGKHTVRVCHGTACHVSGARQVTDELRRGLGIPDGADTDPSRTFTIEEVACLGCCSLAPVLMVDEHTVGKLRPADACDALAVTQAKDSA
jgi:NADH:ubiquinone oxidoreductase subunit E